MKTFQRILILLLFGLFLSTPAQENREKQAARLHLSYSSTLPTKKTKDAYIYNSSGAAADIFVPITLFGNGMANGRQIGIFGLNLGGTYSFGSNGNPTPALPNSFSVLGETSSSVAYQGTDQKQTGFRIGGGPQLNLLFGNRFSVSPIVLAEYFSMKRNELRAVQTTTANGQNSQYNLWTLPETKTTGLAITPKIRLEYLITESLGLFADGSYIFGPKINTQFTTLVPRGNPNQAGQYEQQQLQLGAMVTGETTRSDYSAFGVNFGLSLLFGSGKQLHKDNDSRTYNQNNETFNTLPTKTDRREPPVTQNGHDIFTATHIKKEQNDRKTCLDILSPRNGSNQNINAPLKILINNEAPANGKTVEIKIYKVSRDKDYFSKKENKKELFDIKTSTMIPDRLEDRSKEEGFEPLALRATQKGAVIESSLDKGQLTEGAYKMLVISSCGIDTSNFMVSSSALTTISLTVNCKEKFGDYSYTFVVQNTGSNPINITSIPAFTSSTGVITTFTLSPPLPLVLAPSAIQTFTGGFTYSGIYPGDVYATVSGHQVGNVNLTSQDTEMGEIKSCICDFCKKNAEYDSDPSPTATYNAAGNSLTIHQNWWDMNPVSAAMIVGAKAEIISFSREVSDDCMKCDKDSSQWGNFTTGNSGASIGSFGNATTPVSGNTHHTIYFANPNKFSFDLSISLPPISTLTCCCEKYRIKIRYTYIYKDKNGQCRMCSEVFEYYYQKGSCPKIPGDSDGSPDISTPSNTNISNIKN